MRSDHGSTLLITNVCYGAADGKELLLDILRPHPQPVERMPVIVEIHGGGSKFGEKQGERNQLFAEHGFFTVSLNYRLSDDATFPAQIDDVKLAIRFLRDNAGKYHLDADRIGVWGHSAGGHLAALLGTSGDRRTPEGRPNFDDCSAGVHAVATISGPVDLLRLAGPFEDAVLGGPVRERVELARLANPLSFVTRNAPPFLIIHGTHDEVVPLEHGELLREALEAVDADVSFLPVETGHDVMRERESETMQDLLRFFRKVLQEEN